jgi:hypothetical protein
MSASAVGANQARLSALVQELQTKLGTCRANLAQQAAATQAALEQASMHKHALEAALKRIQELETAQKLGQAPLRVQQDQPQQPVSGSEAGSTNDAQVTRDQAMMGLSVAARSDLECKLVAAS